MRRPTTLAPRALLACGPSLLQAQDLGLRASYLRLDMDTMRVTSRPAEAGVPAPISIRSTLPGRGRDAGGVVETARTEIRDAAGQPILTLIDTLVMDANDLHLRRSRSLRLQGDGQATWDRHLMVVAGALVQITAGEGRTDTTRLALRAGAAPLYATPFAVMRAAPLSSAWHARYDVVVPSERVTESVRTVQIDSVVAATVAARPAWMVHASTVPDVRWAVAIDSATRDLVQFTVARSAAAREGSYDVLFESKRYTSAVSLQRSTTIADPVMLKPLAGRYFLQGVREVGSELLLRPDGTFAFVLSYGALDETGAGSWRIENGDVILQSEGAARAPSVKLVRATGTATDSLHILVVDTAGRPLSGITIDASRKKSSRITAQSMRDGYTLRFERGMPPTELGIGVDMVDFRVPFLLGAPVHAAYRFVFDRGDLGTRRFDRERLAVSPDRLTMTLNGRALTYVRR
ncbi:MAG: hypothetical protein U5K74_02155 [Gemmatimonadaceae bacterium]|nr:hypothetical protein [Gemmatimonadaceae bacterium]